MKMPLGCTGFYVASFLGDLLKTIPAPYLITFSAVKAEQYHDLSCTLIYNFLVIKQMGLTTNLNSLMSDLKR